MTVTTKIGPWLGVENHLLNVCAVEDCQEPAKPQVCLADGEKHYHGCVHYNGSLLSGGLKFRDGQWARLCDTHYAILRDANPERHY